MWWGQNKTKTKRKQHSSRFTPISQKRKAFIHRRDLTSDWCRSWTSKTLATWCKELTHWKSPWCWERLKAGGEGDDRGWEGWTVSRLDGHEFEQAPGVGNGQGSLVCCSPWGGKEFDMTEWLNWTENEAEDSIFSHLWVQHIWPNAAMCEVRELWLLHGRCTQ